MLKYNYCNGGWIMLSRLIFLLFFFFLFPNLALCFIFSPPVVELDIPTGGTREFTLTLINDSSETTLFHLYTTDIVKTKEGRLEFPPPGTVKYSCAKNIELDTSYLLMSPMSQREIKCKITIPSHASGGQYAMIMAEITTKETPQEGIVVTPRWRIGSIIKVGVMGRTMEKIAITNISYKPPTEKEEDRGFIVTLKNEGNIHLRNGKGFLNVMDNNKRVIQRIPFEVKEMIFPESEFDVKLSLDKYLPPGEYITFATINFDRASAVGKETKFSIKEKEAVDKEASSISAPAIVFKIEPTFVKLESPAGGYRTLPLRLKNEEMMKLKIKIIPTDISFDKYGKVSYTEIGKTAYSLANCLKVTPMELVLNPRSENTIQLAISTPKDREGGLYGNLLIEIESIGQEYTISDKRNVPIEVIISKTVKEEGKINNVEINPTKEGINILVEFANEGNVALRPEAVVKVKAIRTLNTIAELPFKTQTVMPKNILNLHTTCPYSEPLLAKGKYEASVEISYGKENKRLFFKKEFEIK